jgi:hypothetical protein
MHFQNGKGGMTIAYEDPAKNRINNPRTFRFSTAIVHPDDTFSRKIGTATAIRNFNEGNVATLPILGGLDIVQTLKSYFYYFDDKLSTEFDAGLEGYAQMYALTQGLAAGIKDATE